MKVIEEGTPFDESWKEKVRCTGKGTTNNGCYSLLEINKKDLFTIYGGGYAESIPYTGIECPVCKVTTCLEDAKVKVPESFGKLPDRNSKERNKESEDCRHTNKERTDSYHKEETLKMHFMES